MTETSDTPNTPEALSPLELAEAKRNARKAAHRALSDARKAIDVDAIDALEIEHGEENVGVLWVPYLSDDLPMAVAVRTPSKNEIKRYRAMIKPKKNGDMPDLAPHVEQVGTSCLVYPAKEVFEALLEKRPGLLIQLGNVALTLSTGREQEEGKG